MSTLIFIISSSSSSSSPSSIIIKKFLTTLMQSCLAFEDVPIKYHVQKKSVLVTSKSRSEKEILSWRKKIKF